MEDEPSAHKPKLRPDYRRKERCQQKTNETNQRAADYGKSLIKLSYSGTALRFGFIFPFTQRLG
jgi:hypothetical protein